jgi:hypothetical protein
VEPNQPGDMQPEHLDDFVLLQALVGGAFALVRLLLSENLDRTVPRFGVVRRGMDDTVTANAQQFGEAHVVLIRILPGSLGEDCFHVE